MNTYYTYPLTCPRVAVPGIRRLWLQRRRNYGPLWLLERTSVPRQFGRIIGNSQASPAMFEVNVTRGNVLATVNNTRTPLRTWDVSLSLNVLRHDLEARDLGQALATWDDTLVLILDGNGTYWLVGEDQGLQVEANTDFGNQEGNNNQVSITGTCRQRWPLRSVGDTYVAQLIALPDTACGLTVADFCALTVAEACALPV